MLYAEKPKSTTAIYFDGNNDDKIKQFVSDHNNKVTKNIFVAYNDTGKQLAKHLLIEVWGQLLMLYTDDWLTVDSAGVFRTLSNTAFRNKYVVNPIVKA